MGALRILVTGSRDWQSCATLQLALDEAAEGTLDVTVVHGGARGADSMAGAEARSRGWLVEVYRADWSQYGKRAGIVRNLKMVNLGADICLAFIRDGSPGATHCAKAAERAGIPVKRYLA